LVRVSLNGQKIDDKTNVALYRDFGYTKQKSQKSPI